MLHVIISLSFFLSVESSLLFDRIEWLSGEESQVRESLANCIFDVSEEYFTNGDIVAFSLATSPTTSSSFSATDTIILGKLHQTKKWNLIIKKSNAKQRKHIFYKKIDSYIFQIRSLAEFNRNLEQLVHASSWNPHAKFLIFLNAVVQDVETALTFFIQELWSYHAVNVVIITHSPKNPLHLMLHSWYPYTCGSCNRLCDKPVLVGECNRNGKLKFNTNLFADKIPNDIQGCTINVLARIWPPFIVKGDEDKKKIHGIEINLLEMIAKSLNFTMAYVLFDEDDDIENFNYRMKKERIDIGIGAIAIGSADESLDYTHSYMQEKITWCVPGALVVPRWKNLLTIFQMHIWFLLFLSLGIVAIFISIVVNKRPFELFSSYHFLIGSVLNLWVILLGFVVNIKFKKFISRFIIILWIIFSLITNCAYQSSLISVLTEPNYNKQIETVDDILAGNFTFGIQKSFRRFINSSRILDELPIINCEKINECFNKVARDRNIVVATSRLYYEYYAKRFVDKYKHQLLHALSDDIINYPVEMLAAKGFPLLEKINLLLLKIREAGFINRWRKNELSLKPEDEEDENVDYIDTGLSMFQMQGAFLGFGLGLLISSIVFFLEIFTIH